MTRAGKSGRQRARQSGSTQVDGVEHVARDANGNGMGGAGPARWWDSPWALGAGGGVLLWAALPPLGWWPLAWFAPLCWLRLIVPATLRGRRPYVGIWLSSVLFWIVVMQGIRLAHWATYFGLIALGLYLGIYLPMFVALARHAVHTWRIPLIVAAPLVWTGVELARGYGPLGFSMATLAHTQVNQLVVIQMADLCGAHGISFVMMLVAACVAAMFSGARQRFRSWPLVPLLLALGVMLGYGMSRLRPIPGDGDAGDVLRVALIQGSIDTLFDDDPDRTWQMLSQYNELTREAGARYGAVDLVVWPESMFPVTDIVMEPNTVPQLDPSVSLARMEDIRAVFRRLLRSGISRIHQHEAGEPGRSTRWMLGTTTWQFGDFPPRHYNAALMVDPAGEVVARYFKMHPVIFGEYVPFGSVIPALYRLSPLSQGLTAGRQPVAVSVAGFSVSPSICFENTIPHLIRWQVAELARRGSSPDVLINLTNDGWFWGSSILDLQLGCAVLRAVELRRPFLVAANTGFSAWIDGDGRIRAQGPRRATGTLLAEVTRDGRWSGYQQWGDMPAGLSTFVCAALIVSGWWTTWRSRRATRACGAR